MTSWACGRPPTKDDFQGDDGDDDFRDADFDISSMANSLTRDVYHRYGVYEVEENDEGELSAFACVNFLFACSYSHRAVVGLLMLCDITCR